MTPTKKDALNWLETTADLLDVLGAEPFRAQAYRSAARSLEALPDWEHAVANGFQGVAKVGAGLGAALREGLTLGRFRPLEEASAQLPPDVTELLSVRGLGPKKVRALWLGGFDSLEALREGLENGGVSVLKGFGAKTAATLLAAVQFVLAARGRQRLNTALDVAEDVAARLNQLEARLSGDVRRGLDTARSARITVTGGPEDVRAGLGELSNQLHLSQVEGRPLLSGNMNGVPVEIAYAPAEARGALDLMMGGGAPYRESLRAEAKAQGYDLSGRGLKRAGARLLTPSEADVFSALGLPYRPAEYREAEHDGVWAQLPAPAALLTLSDIRGYIHTHSTWSDGSASLSDMAQAAQRLGADCYLGTADHSQAAHYAGGLSPERLRAQLKEVRELQRAGVNIIAGSEVDILEDGSLDVDDDLISELDYVVASVHSHFTLSAAAQTERLIKAASHPLITVLGHPTGRLLLRRPSYALDLDAVLQACQERATVVEINASPYRFDLDWRVALKWRERLTFAVNTDAHSPGGLGDARYGVMVARKAGLSAAQVVNALTQEQFLAFVGAQRAQRH